MLDKEKHDHAATFRRYRTKMHNSKKNSKINYEARNCEITL